MWILAQKKILVCVSLSLSIAQQIRKDLSPTVAARIYFLLIFFGFSFRIPKLSIHSLIIESKCCFQRSCKMQIKYRKESRLKQIRTRVILNECLWAAVKLEAQWVNKNSRISYQHVEMISLIGKVVEIKIKNWFSNLNSEVKHYRSIKVVQLMKLVMKSISQ